MVQKRFSIALDIKRPTANRDFEVVEGDNGNVLEVTLTDDGVPVDLAGCRVYTIFSKSDGTAQQDNDGRGITVEGNKMTISLYTTSVAPGLVECELQVYSGEGQTTLVTSAKFNFMCRRGIANDDTIESTDEWPLLIDLIQRTEAVEEAEALRVIAESGRVERDAAYRQLEPYDPEASYVPLNKVTFHGSCYECIQAAAGIAPPNADYWIRIAAAGEGDMSREVYDSDRNGIVDNAERLGGQLPSYYATVNEYTAEIPATGWTGTGPWQQTVSVPGITPDMVPFVDVVLDDGGNNALRVAAFGGIDRVVTGTDEITLHCYVAKPTDDISIRLRMVQ